jgi:hypothetical protein
MKFRESKASSAKEIEFSTDLLLASLRGHTKQLEAKKKAIQTKSQRDFTIQPTALRIPIF